LLAVLLNGVAHGALHAARNSVRAAITSNGHGRAGWLRQPAGGSHFREQSIVRE
jgi:hypothetical protein